MLRPVRTGNPFEETVERLLQLVKLGMVGVGERLPAERDLAGRLGVGRITVRQAIASLREAGYLASRRGRGGGTFVVSRHGCSQPRDVARVALEMGPALDDVLRLRLALEPGAAELAATATPSPADRSRLVALLAEVRAAPANSYRPLDSRLHIAVAELSGSPSLAAQVADARLRINDLLDAIPLMEPSLEHSNEQHERVVQAILAGDPDAARVAMREHLQGTSALLRAFLG
jgi:DNA-binding FadR family transcriptional regulator